uniref:2'-5' oligoadenylate synthetase-like 2 n=1 Tax=Nannospalax galili TaxID=1026970 RepID=A0A8C6RP98_NANGA
MRCKYPRLLTIYAWEMGTKKSDNFNMSEGFVAVMELFRDYKDICIYWTKYYDFQSKVVRGFLKQQLKGNRPIILDPADPTNNIGKRKGWDLIAKEAAYCLRQDCCIIEDASQGWNRARDIQVTVKQTGKETWRLWANPHRPIRKMKPKGKRQLLSSQKTLADYGIFSEVSIPVLKTFPPEIQVFVKESRGQSKPYAIDPDDTIDV